MKNKKYILVGLMSCIVLGTLTACIGSSVNQFVKIVQKADEKENWINEYKIDSVRENFEYSYLNLDVQDLEIILKKGEKSGYDIFCNQEDVKLGEYFEIEKTETGLNIKTISKNKNQPKLRMVVYATSPEQMKLNMICEDSVLVAEHSFAQLDVVAEDTVLTLEGETAYPMDINTEDTVVVMDFDTIDAAFSLSLQDSVVTLPEHNEMRIDTRYEDTKTIGKGTHEVKIIGTDTVITVAERRNH